MSIQSSMNALLASGAVLGHLAQPMRNAELLSKEKEKEYKKILDLTKSVTVDDFETLPIDEQMSILQGNLRDFGLETDYQSDYIDALTRMHEAAPGNTAISRRLEDAKSLSPEMNKARANIGEQLNIVGKDVSGANIDADFIEKKMQERGNKISPKGQQLGKAKIEKARAMKNAFEALDERYLDITQQNIAARKGISEDVIKKAAGRQFKQTNEALHRALEKESSASWEVGK